MDFPIGFPPHLRPRAEAAVSKASRRFLTNELARMKAGFHAFAEIVVKAAEDGEYSAASAHFGLNYFLDYIFDEDPYGPPMRLRHPTSISGLFKFDIKRSRKWLRYMERLDALTKQRGVKSVDPPTSIAEQIKSLRLECRLTTEQLSELIGISTRSVERHLAGAATPRKSQIAEYERVFSEKLRRTVSLGNVG